MKTVIIDNYDSFTYNLSHLIKELGAQVTVFRNDCFELSQLSQFDKIILSPGPGIPEEAGLLTEVISTYAGIKPMLGVCLGHQAIGEVFGGRVIGAGAIVHGKTSRIKHCGSGCYEGLPQSMEIGRYHSLIVERASLPDCFEVTAELEDGMIMGLRHKEYDIEGMQFHPESILTPLGYKLMENFLKRIKK